MKRLPLIALTVLVAAPVAADPFLQVTPNAYGLGMGMDQYGRAIPHDPFQRVTPNAYGLGVGMDQYGRPVRYAAPVNGQMRQGCTNLQAKVFPVRCGVMTAEQKAELKAEKKAAKAQGKAERKAARKAR